MSSPGFENSPDGTAVSVTNHYTGWEKERPFSPLKLPSMPRLMAYTVRVCPTHGRVWFPERAVLHRGSKARRKIKFQDEGGSDSDEDKTVWEYCQKVFGSSSVSGVNHIALAKTRRRRIFWAFIFIVSLVGFFYQLGAFLVQYREFQSIVQIDIQNAGSLMFPAVTLCNANRFFLLFVTISMCVSLIVYLSIEIVT
ncbi:amiloride-sensitive sodium channel subunit beta-2 [Trichonephila clavipes]|nr:amiloride-sensitive sodium channel subunit beta-2 [Trichonephila clavipes]